MMKRKIVVFVVALVFAGLLFGSGLYVGAATKNGAGSQNDPVVTLSYLEYRLDQLETGNGNGGNTATIPAGYKKMVLTRGERYVPGEGGVFVLYSGKCTAVGKGLIDLTGARTLVESESIPAYSQILVPDETSGVVASEETVLFVVK